MRTYENIYFIGIGGIGMSAIARYYNTRGFKVSGYDKTPSPLTAALESEGIYIHYTDNVSYIPEDKENTLVIYTPAIPADMQELVYVQQNGYRTVKRSRILGEISEGQRCMAVAGTHGKTTTSTLVAHIFHDSGEGCSAFLGGISKNYNSNLLVSTNNVIVAEADEFDRSFLQLYPEIAVITSMDADHLDIYNDIKSIHEAFKEFASQVSDTLIIKHGLNITSKDTKAHILTYSYDNPKADFYASNVLKDDYGHYHFDLNHPGGCIHNCTLGILGWVNVENAIAASAIALTYGIDADKISNALASYSGVKRRFDLHVNRPGCTYIDDYAHHPKEIEAALSSIRAIFPKRHITAIFQPHLYTRTRDFADDFAKALSIADKVILLDIYPAREEPIPGVTSEIIFKNITSSEKVLIKRDELMERLEHEDIDVLITFGAGNIDRFVTPIADMLDRR